MLAAVLKTASVGARFMDVGFFWCGVLYRIHLRALELGTYSVCCGNFFAE